MTKRVLGTLACLMALGMSSCATVRAVEWSYRVPNDWDQDVDDPEDDVMRPALGPVMIPAAFAFDVVTFPVQAIFGVWPIWGDASIYQNPNR